MFDRQIQVKADGVRIADGSGVVRAFIAVAGGAPGVVLFDAEGQAVGGVKVNFGGGVTVVAVDAAGEAKGAVLFEGEPIVATLDGEGEPIYFGSVFDLAPRVHSNLFQHCN